MPDPVYTVAMEFTANSFTQITSDCLRVSITRQLATYEQGLSMGRLDLILDNLERKYSPANSSSVYYPNLKPNKRVRVQATYSGTTQDLFTGYVDTYSIDPQWGRKSTYIQASDRIKDINFRDIDLSIKVNYNTGSLFTEVLSAAGVSGADSVVDSFSDIIGYAWFEKRKGTAPIDELIKYGDYKVFVDGSGKVQVKNRYYDLLGTVVASYNEFLSYQYQLDEQGIGNVLRVSGSPRKVSAFQSIVAKLDRVLTVVGCGWTSFWLDYVDPDTNEAPIPVTSMATPVASIDYLLNTASGGTGTNLTATASLSFINYATTTVCTLFNGIVDTAYVTKFQLRGYPIQRQPLVSAESEVVSSQNAYNKRSFTLESDLIDSLPYAQNYVTYLVFDKKDPLDKLSIEVKNEWDKMLGTEVGDLLSIVESLSAIGSPFTVMAVDHEISWERGLEHVCKYELEKWQDREWLILDHATAGVLDSKRLGF